MNEVIEEPGTHPAGVKPRRTYVAVHGQFDNIGDSVLRRGMLSTTDDNGQRHVLIGRGGPDYASGLGLRPDDRVYRYRRQWQLAAFWGALTRPIRFLSNAGEMQDNRRRRLIALADLPVIAVSKLRRGSIAAHTGVGVRVIGEGRRPWSIMAPARLCRLVTWRDQGSRDFAGFGEVRPDWAIVEGMCGDELQEAFASPEQRDLLVVSMRGDRGAPSERWFDAVRQIASELDLRVVVANQVVRDAARTSEIAARLGGVEEIWLGGSHFEREKAMRELYSRARATVSDRLHVLIMAMTEGAVPLGITATTNDKLDRTLRGIGLVDATRLADSAVVGATVEWALRAAQRSDYANIIEDARRRLREVGHATKAGADHAG